MKSQKDKKIFSDNKILNNITINVTFQFEYVSISQIIFS
jgi:hypothetical protein